ncbi:hypothetical protein ILUMI_13801 [Ignelater luminosus]|uniref:CHHC U11-48K-type domain-containing protein n=1 Tax=Ignelater luminosus TaxID=2038154 RepID=A0A8K0CRL5_IGNLU|nr:hypothetical protein ILUMI_13801 [Ignelater luminosus]
MDFNLDVRLKQLESLEQYISSSRDKVQSILDCFKWNAKEVLKDTHLIKCSVNINHRIHSKNADEHVQKCQLRSEGYDLNEDFLSEPVDNTNSSIFIDHDKKIEILSAAHTSIPDFRSAWNGQDPDPKTANRYISTYSPDERLALYEYVVKNTVGPPELPEFNTVQPVKSDDKSLSYEEMRMRERDAKRRRIKYKSVHTNRKSHKEVLREVIEGQMEMYKDWLIDNSLVPSTERKENNSTNILDVKSEHEQSYDEQQKSGHSSVTDYSEHDHSVISRNSTHSGSSKSTVRKRSKDRHEYNHRKRYHDGNYKRYHGSSSRDHKRQRSRERYEYRKYQRSHSARHEHADRHRYGHYKER